MTERIRLNGKPIAKEAFAIYFFQVWDRLQATLATPVPADDVVINNVNAAVELMNMPGYFQLLTLVRVRSGAGTLICFDVGAVTQNVVLMSPVNRAIFTLIEMRMDVLACCQHVCAGVLRKGVKQ